MKTIARRAPDIGNAIRRWRRQAGLSQSKLSSLCGVTQETISKIESGATSARLDTIFTILAELDLELVVQHRGLSDQSMEDIF